MSKRKAQNAAPEIPEKEASQALTDEPKQDDISEDQKPDFIYGGPFISVKDTPQFLDTRTPKNIQLQGTFKKSFAYFSLKERLPIILTKVIDQLSKQGQTDAIQYIAKLKSDLVTNKKYELFTLQTPQTRKWNEWILQLQHPYYFTNTWVFSECYVYARLWEGLQLNGLKDFDPFAEQKQQAFESTVEPMCVVAIKLIDMLPESEPEKRKTDFIKLLKIALWSNKCDLSLSAGEPVSMKPKAAGDSEPKADTKNKSKTAAPSDTETAGNDAKEEDEVPKGGIINPFKMIIDFKDKVLVDQSAKIAQAVVNKSLAMAKKIQDPVPTFVPGPEEENNPDGETLQTSEFPETPDTPSTTTGTPSTTPGTPVSGSATPTSGPDTPTSTPGTPVEEHEQPKFPCFAKMTKPREIIFDIVCDNAGYELFTDLCLAHFLISQKIVQKVRFHVKKIPWFVSDVTEKDFMYILDACSTAEYYKKIHPEDLEDEKKVTPSPAPVESEPQEGRYDLQKAQIGVVLEPEFDPVAPAEETQPEPEAPPPITELTAGPLQNLGKQWKQFLDDGTFILESDEFWVSPHVYADMKKYNYNLYRKLQFSVAVLFKGDLNYRKLLGEMNLSHVAKFPAALKTFKPAPIIALRTVKAELVCGLKKKKAAQMAKLDPKWMETGDYGVIQYCPKAEKLKVSIYPCPGFIDYKKMEPEPEPEPELEPVSEPEPAVDTKSKSKKEKVKFKSDPQANLSPDTDPK